ncbi:hypothetical protein [Nocardia brasiliensis]|uniref:hypothetical protein n=1 Tax=Nocardia brasiliensis TaxID=37326 RepID=UPI002455CB5F|nr:hypothetical protein [Nocardia brasiliensis]
MSTSEKPSFESVVRAAVARIDRCFANDDNGEYDPHEADLQYTLEEVEQLLRAALPDDDEDEPWQVGATEGMDYDDDTDQEQEAGR